MKVGKMLIYACLAIFICFGLVLIVLGFMHGYNKIFYLKKAVRTIGKVIEIVEELSNDSDNGVHPVYKPKVQFESIDGEIITFVSSVASTPSPYKVGDRVKVLYMANDNSDPQINSFSELWFGPLFLIFMGSMFVLFPVMAMLQIHNYTGV